MTLFSLLLFLTPVGAQTACQSTGQCSMDAQNSIKGCSDRMAQLKSYDALKAGQASSAMSQLGSNVAPAAGQMNQTSSMIAAQNQAAADFCKTCLQACVQSCSASREPRDLADKQKCEKQIGYSISQAEAAAQEARQAAQDASKTGDSAEGQKGQQQPPPQMPQGNSGGEPKTASIPPAGNVDSGAADCSGPDAYKNEKCAEKVEDKCSSSGDYSSAQCAGFAAAYCATDRTGKGVATDYCRQRLASGYCAKAGKQNCPSCNPKVSLASAGAECQDDPRFADPANIAANKESSKAPSTSSAVGAAVGSGGGGGSMGSGGSAKLDDPTTGSAPAAAQSPYKDLGNLAVAGGGGGGGAAGGSGLSGATGSYGSESGVNDSGKKKADGKPAIADVNAGAAVAGVAPNRFGPSVFAMSSEVIKARCAKGRFLHCVPTK